MNTFAGFPYPKKLYFLPAKYGGLRKKRQLRKHCGQYYQNTPAANPDGRVFYLDSDFMPGLRWNYCDNEAKHIRHTGWFIDEFQADTIRGMVFRLPHEKGFLAGWTMGDGMISGVEYYIYDDEISAAYAADALAERAAEDERAYRENDDEE